MPFFSLLRSLCASRLLSRGVLVISLGAITSWAAWSGYTADKPRGEQSIQASPALKKTEKRADLHLDKQYGALPLSFEENRGQANTESKFIARGPGYNILLHPDKAVLAFKNPVKEEDNTSSPDDDQLVGVQRLRERLRREKTEGSQSIVTMRLEGANENASAVEGTDQLEGKVSYFLGNDPAKWLTDIPTFGKVEYREVYRGVDVVFYGNGQQLEYDLVVAPNIDPSIIQLKFDGIDSAKIDKQGNLRLQTPGGELRQLKPQIYQNVDGQKRPVKGTYVLRPGNKIGFKISKYDRKQPLVIDPTLNFLSFVNSSSEGFAITTDTAGFAYITGYAADADLNTTPGVVQGSFGGFIDCFVTKLNQNGTEVLFTTYLGSAEFDDGNSIAVDNSGNVYIGGAAGDGFPTTGGTYQTVFGGVSDGFVAKLNPTGSTLLFSTLIGGSGTEEVDTIILEAGTGNMFVSGLTTSVDLNTTPGVIGPTNKGGYECFVAKFNANATNVVFLTYVGSSGFDYPISMAPDSNGNIYLAGQTSGLDFPTLNAAYPIHAGATRGPFKSINGGANWSSSRSGLPATFVYTSVINPTTPSIIYLGTDGGVFKTTDSGATWNPTAQLPVPRVHQLTLVPGAPNIIYAGTEAGVFRSIDSGATWVPRNNGLETSGQVSDVRGIAIHQSAPNTIYAAALNGIFKSTDGGGNWALIINGLTVGATNALTNAIVVDPSSANTLYIGNGSTTRVWKTTNGGANWTAASTGLINSQVRALAINPTTPNTLYVANGAGIYKTTNGGTNWAAANTGLTLPLSDATNINNPPMTFVAVDPVTPTTVYAGAGSFLQANGAASASTVFKSTDSGATWTGLSSGFGSINSSIGTIVVDPTNASTIFASTLGDYDAFLLKLNPSVTASIFGTYFGSNRADSATSLALDISGNAYIAGSAGGTNFPTSAGAFQTVLKGSSDIFSAKFTSGGALQYSTLIGGTDAEGTSGGIAVDSSGSAFITGTTFGPDFPTTAGAFQRTIGNPGTRNLDAVIIKLNPAGTALDFASYLGGDGNDNINNFLGNRIALDAAGNAYVVGSTNSTNFPYFDWANAGGNATTHTFVAKISSTAPSFSITGRITNSQGGAGVAGIYVDVIKTGGRRSGNSALTDAQGYFAAINLEPGDYTVTPQRFSQATFNHYIFAPASRSFPGLNSDQTANFVATQAFDISGQVSHASIAGLGIFDVTVNLTGTASATTVTDVNGFFAFRDVTAGNYTVTPSKAGFAFNPVNRVFNALSADQFATFTTSSGTYVTVSGKAMDVNNVGISGAVVVMQIRPQIGSKQQAVQTDANGNYSISNLQAGGIYKFQAFKEVITFAPQEQTYSNLIANQTLNFVGTGATGLIGKIAYLKENVSSTAVAVSNADGSNEVSLNTINGQCSGDGGPAWSPDGSRLVFDTCNANGNNTDLYIMNADGSNVTPLVTDPDVSEQFANWSPDGTRLTYTFGECSGTDVLIPEVFAVDSSGKIKSNLTNNNLIDGVSDWSPSGSTILFSRGTTGECSGVDTVSDLYTIDAVGGNEQRLTNTTDSELSAAYSPDGTKIAVARSSENLATGVFNDVIYVMNSDGTNPVPISPTIISASKPTWSPDGKKIAFGGYINSTNIPSQIYVVNIDGTGLAPVTNTTNESRILPSWQHYSISGRVTGNTTGVPITMTLAGTLTRVGYTDAAGNYVFGNLTPGGNYTVTPISTAFGFTPAKIDVNNLTGNQIANFALLPAVIPAPTPPLADDFAAAQRDPAKWNLGTQTQPLGAFDPQVTVTQQSGQLSVTPLAQTAGLHYNGYVAVNSFDFNNAKATVEVVQPATGAAETIFAIGSDLENFTRFVISAGGTSAPGKGRGPKQVGLPQLVFQVHIGSSLTQISIPYDPVAHRFMRFRHEPPTNSIVFETSPDNVNFTVRHSVVLQRSVSAVTAELSAGTSTSTNPGTAVFDNFNLVTNTFQFQVTSTTINESANRAIITVTRGGDISSPASVDYSTFDDTARQRTRYVPAVGTLTFAAGQSARTFSVLLPDNSLVEGSQTLTLRLLDSFGGGLNSPGRAVLTVDDNDTPPITTNPLDEAQFFVRQHYYDFLSRNPDPGGLNFWTNEITQCGSNQACINIKRIDVSNAFYFELEFQQTGSYVYRLYRVAFGNNQPFPNPRPDVNFPNEEKKLLSYTSFTADRARVIGGAGLAQSQLNLATAFIKRPEFLATYPLSLDGPGFVDAVLQKLRTDIGVDMATQRAALLSLYNTGGRAAVLYRLADDNVGSNPINNRAFIDAEYNRAFVVTQYFGYLRRNPDLGGFIFWLGQVNSGPLRDVNKQHAMVCSFVTSTEFQERFSLAVTHNNTECAH